MEVEIEATAALFDHVDGWQGRRRVLPMEIEPALEEMPLAEEWVGGGQLLRSGRRLVWRSRGPKLEIAEVPGQVDGHGPRNGMELPFSVLSRDAVCFEEVADSREECLVLWALTRNLVLHAVPFKPPSASGGGHGRGSVSPSNSTVTSLLAALPTREACDGVALNPPAGSEYPTCCSFVTPRDLLVGYGTGKLQLIRVTRQGGDAGVGVGEGPHMVQAEVVRELPASGYLSYLNPLAYRQAAQPPSSPVVALGGWAAGGSELLVFSLHADRKLRVWSTRSSKGVMLSELALPGAVDRGLLYAGCSKVLVHTDAGASRLVVSLTEPSHSRVWVSKPFSSAAEVEGWKDTHLAAHCFEENQLLADVCLVASDDQGEEGGEEVAVGARGSPSRGSPKRRPPRPRRLRLWAALANDGLAYAPLEAKKGGAGWTSGWVPGGGGDQGGGEDPASLIRLWQAPPSGLEDVGLLLGSAAIGGGGEKGQGSGRRDALRQSLLLLHARFGPQWEATVRHVEASFLRFLAAPPSRFSSMALVKAMERMRSAPSLSGAGGRGRGGGGGRRGGHGDVDREPLPTGEQLWEMVAGVVRKEADQALAEAVRQQPRYQQRQQDEEEAGMAEGEKRALALLSAWVHFLDLVEQSREVLSQPLALMAGGDSSTKGGASVVAVRVDRCSTAVPIRLPLAHHLTFLDAFDRWMSECAPEATLDVNRCLSEALATTGQLPDPVLLKARAAEALQRRRPGKGLDAGLVLRGAGENPQTRIELSTQGYQAVEEVEEVLDALRSLLQVLGETKKAAATVRRSSRRSQGGGASASSMEVVSSQDASNSHSSSRLNSLATAALTASAIGEILALCLARLRTSLMLVVHLETAGLQQLLLRGPLEAPLAVQVATALNVAWLLYYSASQPLLPPAPIRSPSAVALSAVPRAGARALSVLEDLVLDLLSSPSTSVSAVHEATQAVCQGLPWRLLAHVMKAEQYRYLLPWARGLLDGALLLPSTSWTEDASAEEETRRVATRRWQRLVVYAFLSEARRVSRRGGQANAAEVLFARAIEALEEWDTCLAPPFVDIEGQDEEGGGRDRQDSMDGEGGEGGQVPRLAHYVQAVGLLEQSVGLPGCLPRRLADLAYAGLRHVPAFPDRLGEGDRAQQERLKWCLQHAAALWATVFRACTDHTAAGAWQGAGEEEGGSSSSSSDALAADAGAFEEAFLAMHAELAVARDLEELTAHGDQEDGEAASGGPAASRRSRNSKLSYLVVEMCERGRIDLVCSLPWAQGDAEDEVSEVEMCLRSSARFSTIEEGEEDDEAMDLASGGGGGGNVDYYKAAFAFLVSQSNFRLAALGMYRLAKRLEDATVYEDNLARLDRKVEALAAVHNCLCLVRDGGEYPFLLWTYDDKARPPSSASASASAGGGSKKQCVVTLKRVEQELTYALAARQYLLVAGPNASPLRALSLSQAQAQPGAGDASGKLNKAAVHQVEAAAALLCGAGLYESAVALVKAFGLHMHDVVASLAKTYAVLRGGRADGHMVLEDGPRWNVGDLDEVQEGDGSDGGSARREVYIRLAKTLAEEGKEAKVVAEHAEAAGWLLKDLVQGYDWAHAYKLHTEAARYLLACDSFVEFPRWLTSAFTRGVDARLVKTPSRKDKGGIGDQSRALGAWLDTSSSSSPVTRVPVANSGAFLQMHVDKAMYILAPPGGSQNKVAGGRRIAAGGSLPSETVLKESLHLLGRALGYAEEMLDAATDQLVMDGPVKVWLPRRSLSTLLQRTQEVLEMPIGGGEALASLRHQVEAGLRNLRDRKLPVFDQQLRDKERMVALMLQQPQGFRGEARSQRY